ncbi:MAG: hypothetical protein K0R93_1658 [Anaerosolibacter sp.]|uniref:DUF1294 domain-containing protein n=1 Tax=Anaerosolibacter sp. TaxID=1872527 RepID=UPI00261C5F14|nr:DUF1294 domain-containing protein [Anaerosolibacter sp.]MDF2546760.1 hypothetical protein [Anaerosolibacter sp.]
MKMIIDVFGFDERKFLIFMGYLALVNIYGFVIMGLDKYYAKKHRWRISERNFFLTSLLGGAWGVLLGMKMFRHKTLHKSFTFGVPALGVLHVAIVLSIYYFFFLK